MKRPPEAAAANRVAEIDWRQVAASLDERGYATTAALLTTEQCRGLAALYDRDEAFRSRVIMQRHAFGRGEYKYLRYPLPARSRRCARRSIRISRRSPIAGASELREEGRFPPTLAAYLDECHRAGQERPTPLHPQIRSRRLQLPAPGSLWRAGLPAPADGAAERDRGRLHRRRVPARRAAASRAIARRGRAVAAGRGGDLPGPSPTGRRHPRSLSGDDAPRRQPHALRPALSPSASSSTTRREPEVAIRHPRRAG